MFPRPAGAGDHRVITRWSVLDFLRRLCHSAAVGITLQQFEQMQGRVRGTRHATRVVGDDPERIVPAEPRVILGIDPSLRGTGYGVIRWGRPVPIALTHGTVKCPPRWERSRCLATIAETLRDVVRQYQPTVCVVEGLFYAQNLRTALILGEARGVALVAAAEAGLEILEIAPKKVKQAIVGHGGAQKLAVAKMVQRMLNLQEPPAPDAADALALALAHAQASGRYRLYAPRRL